MTFAKFRKNSLDTIMLILLAGLLVALHFFVFHRLEFADDKNYLNATYDRSTWSMLKSDYFDWSGRLVIDAAILSLIRYVFVWRVLNAALVLALGYTIGRLGLGKNNLNAAFAIGIATLFLIQDTVWAEAVAWVIGSYNYLWPLALGIISLLHFIYPKMRQLKLSSVILILCSFYAVNAEQVALIVVAFGTLWIIYLIYKKEATAWHYLHMAVIYLGAIFLFTTPGSHNRYITEARNWYPDHVSFGAFQKFMLGVGRLLEHAYNPSNIIMQILALLVIILICREKISAFSKSIIILASGLAVLPMLFKVMGGAGELNWLYFVDKVDISNFLHIEAYFRVGLLMFSLAMIAVGVCVVFIKNWNFESIQIPLVFIAAMMSTIIIGFSSTVYASGLRVLYVGDVGFALVVCALLGRLSSIPEYKPLFLFMKYGIYILAIIQMINYFSHINTDWPFG